MAILDNKVPTGPQQGNAPPGGYNDAQPAQGGSPPSYGTYQSGSIPAQVYPGVQPYPVARQYNAGLRPGPAEPAPRRFFKAFVTAALVWFLLTAFAQSLVHLAHWSHRHRHNYSYPIPGGISLDRCVSGGEWWDEGVAPAYPPTAGQLPPSTFPFTSKTFFDLPLSSDTLFLLSRGPLSSGSVYIDTSGESSDIVKVQVSVKYFRESVRDTAKVCLITRHEGEVGVGIFSPSWPSPSRLQDRLYFETVIVLPKSADDSPLVINKLETDVPNTLHRINDLYKKVNFRKIVLKGSNAPIHVQSIYAKDGVIETSNSPIEGSFNSSRSLTLRTSNAPIRVDVGLTSHKESSSPELVVRTTNNVLDANVSLISASDSGGEFHVTGTTSNGPLRIKFPTAPVDSTLHLEGKTTNSPATVSLHPSYEGKFFLATTNNMASLYRNSHVEDPSGKGRKRSVTYQSVRQRSVSGNVHWEGSEKAAGSVDVKTSNSRALLEL